MGTFSAVRLTDRVYWVGAIDWELRDFHGYRTGRGTTYNAYLVMADKVLLVDTVKRPFLDEMMARIASVVEPSRIQCLVSNHSEMDHSGSIPEVIRAVKPEAVYASTNGVKALREHFHLDADLTAVSDGERITLGDLNVTCLETRMLHWPDSMVTYVEEEKVLFSQDGFGMHLASSERFDDQLPADVLEQEAAKYFANILLPFSGLVTKLLERLASLNLDVELLCPDHGPVWRKDIAGIIERWGRWARQEPGRKAVVVYDTMWQSTALMARAIGEGIAATGASAKLMPLSAAHRSDVATELLDAGALVVGSPTMNNQLFPTVADCMTYLKGLKPKGLVGAAFGSYGWSGEAVRYLEQTLDEIKIERVADSVKAKYVPTQEDLAQCRRLGESVGERLVGTCGG